MPNGRAIVIEMKTTDAHSIHLNTIAGYRRALIADGVISEELSSTLVVVGQQETDNIEAQTRRRPRRSTRRSGRLTPLTAGRRFV